MDSLEHGGKENEEANVLMRCLPGFEQVQPIELGRISDDRHRPVAVFSGSVDSGERFFVEDGLQTMSERDTTKRCHHELVVVDGEIRFLEVRRHLELTRRDFVVTSSDWHAELVELELCFGDATLDALRNSAEVVILELLSARGRRTDESTSAHDEVRTHSKVGAIDEEILLLGTERGEDALHSLVADKLEQRD